MVEGAIDSTVCHRAVDRITSEHSQKSFKTLQERQRPSRGEVKCGLGGRMLREDTVAPGEPTDTHTTHPPPPRARTAPEDRAVTSLTCRQF